MYDPHGFFHSDFKEGVETLRREDINGDDAAKVAPMFAIGRRTHARVVVEQILSGEEAWPVSENDVVFGEAFLNQGWGGDDHNKA